MDVKKEWENKTTKYRKKPFAYITIYQFFIPIIILIALNTLYLYIHQTFQIHFTYYALLAPLILMGNYFLFIFLVIIFSKFLSDYYEKKSPTREGTFKRKFSEKKAGMATKNLQYYHLRGFLYKFPMFLAKKSPFPGLLNYSLREVGKNAISKDALYGDAYVALEMTEIKEGAVILDGSCISSHVVDSIFGNLSIKKVKLGQNCTIFPHTAIAPGTTVPSHTSIGPRSFCPKNWSYNHNPQDLEKSQIIPSKEMIINEIYVYGAPAKKALKRGVKKSLFEYIPSSFLDKTRNHE